jgi:hypothetical protein
MRDQKSRGFGLICDTPRQGYARLRNARKVGAAACLVLVLGSAGAIAQDAEALRQLEWCKNASKMVSDAHGISASTTSPGYVRMAEIACSKAIELFGIRQERWEAYFTRGFNIYGKERPRARDRGLHQGDRIYLDRELAALLVASLFSHHENIVFDW